MRSAVRWGLALAAVVAVCDGGQAWGLIGADRVASSDIAEADFRTGQNTNAGNGIKTGHIQPSAVSESKIKDAAVTERKIKDAAVTNRKIKDGAITYNKIKDAAITYTKIKDGAVVNSKLGNGSVTAAKLADGAVSASKVAFYGRVVVVDASGGGDYTSPVDAMAALAALNPAPGADNPYLVKIMPGTYDVGGTSVRMLPFADIEGSGDGVTMITGAVPPVTGASGVVLGADNAELRMLTVRSTFSTDTDTGKSAAILNNGTSPTIWKVTARAEGSGAKTQNYAIYNVDNNPLIDGVTLVAAGGWYATGMLNDGASGVVRNAIISASNSENLYGVRNTLGSSIQLSRAEISVTALGGVSKTWGVAIQDASTSPLRDVEVSVSGGGGYNYAVKIEDSSPSLRGVRTSASGTDAVGIIVIGDSSPGIGEGSAFGTSAGLRTVCSTNGCPTVTLDHLLLQSDTASAVNESGATLQMMGTWLSAAYDTATGSWTCGGCVNASYQSLDSTCAPLP